MSNLGPESRALLDEGRNALRPIAADQERVLAALHAGMVTGIPIPMGETVSPAASSSLSWPVISTVVVGLVFGGGLLLNRLNTADALRTSAVLASSTNARAVTAASAGVVALVLPGAAPAAAPPPSAELRASAPGRTDNLSEEVALLSRAERELHSGRFTAALALLRDHQHRFPRGALAEERVAARIQALCGLGRVKEADSELARVSPESLHAGRVREACAANAAK